MKIDREIAGMMLENVAMQNHLLWIAQVTLNGGNDLIRSIHDRAMRGLSLSDGKEKQGGEEEPEEIKAAKPAAPVAPEKKKPGRKPGQKNAPKKIEIKTKGKPGPKPKALANGASEHAAHA